MLFRSVILNETKWSEESKLFCKRFFLRQNDNAELTF